jgi:hypothetical protein
VAERLVMRSFLLDPTDAPDFEVVYTIHGVYEVGASNVLKLDPHTPQGHDVAGPLFSWARGFLVGSLLSAAVVADMLGYGWNAFAL